MFLLPRAHRPPWRLLTGLLVVTVALAAPASAVIPPDTSCRSGQVSITFDDGPSKVNTPKLLTILRNNQAQATFFVQGQYAKKYPGILRDMVRDGHAVEDHSWNHPDLREESSREVRRQLGRTRSAIIDAVDVEPQYYRPPYGSTDRRVRKVARGQGLKEVIWTIDTRDWTGQRPRKIRRAALKGLRKHRSNVILMHDNVTNSPATLKAVPGIIKGLRDKGYCLVPLQQMMPLGTVSAAPVRVARPEAGPVVVPVTFTMDGPAQRDGSFRVRSRDGTAAAGTDYSAVDQTLSVRRGDVSTTVLVLVDAAASSRRDATFRLVLDRAKGLEVAAPAVPVTVAGRLPEVDSPTADLILSTPNRPATLAP